MQVPPLPRPTMLPPGTDDRYLAPAATQPRPTGVTPLSLPTPQRVIREGVDLLTLWHPRSPGIRIFGQSQLPVTGASTPPANPTPQTDAPDKPAESSQASQRSDFAKAAMWIGVGGGVTQNVIDVFRLIKKYPEALRAGNFDPTFGKLGRLPTALGLTALTRPDNRIIDPRWRGMAASIETGGRTFDKFDDITMKTSVLLGASIALVQVGASIPNLVDAVRQDGPWYENLATTMSGRAGVLQLAGGTLGLSVFALGLKQTAGTAGPGFIQKVVAAGSAPIVAKPIWGRIGLGFGAMVVANELGYLDWLNKGEHRPIGKALSDAAHRTPVLNDPQFRTAALLGAGAIVGFKANRAIAAAGGLAGLKAGHVIGGAVIAGLLGAQLLGALSGMDKPT